jgi:hypothetical protein
LVDVEVCVFDGVNGDVCVAKVDDVEDTDEDGDDDEDEDEDVEEELLVLGVSKSPCLYLIHIPGAGIGFPLNVKVLETPPASPSPVYAIVVITVESIVDPQNVDEVPPNTAGAVCELKPGPQQKAVVVPLELPTVFVSHPLGQSPGE